MHTHMPLGRPQPLDFTPSPGLAITARLRTETRPDHDAIEANPRMNRLMASDLTLPEYAAILIRMGGFHGPAEQGLRRWASHFPDALDVEARLVKTALLRRDLADLGFPSTEAGRDPRSLFGDFATIEAAWGCLYVIEGSTLGGQIIARHLKAAVGVTAERGAAFHLPYGPLTGARWQAFRAAITDETEHRSLNADAIVAGARAAFAALDVWMAADQ